jgi:predicted MFS family arabinose efflux permease
MMRPAELHQRPVVVRAKGQVREGLRYVWSTRELRDPLLAMAVVGIFAFNFTTTLPLLATHTFHGGAGTYSALLAAMGAGAVIGGLMVAHRSQPSTAMLSVIGLAFGFMLLVVAVAPTEILGLAALVFMGLWSSWGSAVSPSYPLPTPPSSCRPTRPCAAGSWPSTPSPSSGAPPSELHWWVGSPTPATRGSP